MKLNNCIEFLRPEEIQEFLQAFIFVNFDGEDDIEKLNNLCIQQGWNFNGSEIEIGGNLYEI